ncbi:hypothetical protein BH10BAC4_BH10BAC4_13350 [soil metagenome]
MVAPDRELFHLQHVYWIGPINPITFEMVFESRDRIVNPVQRFQVGFNGEA